MFKKFFCIVAISAIIASCFCCNASAEESAFSYLYFEKNVDYNITPNITKSNSKINKLQANECAISIELSRLIDVNVGDEIKIDISANEYIYKVA